MTTPRQHAINVLKFSRKVSTDLVKDFPEDKFTWQASPADNHAAWALMHIAMTDAWYAGLVGAKGTSVPEGWDKLVGPGSKPVNEPKKYPKPAEAKRVFEENRAAVLNWLEGASDKDLALQLGEKTGGFMLDPIDGALKLSWHEGWHMGQVATCRKALGLPPVLG